jgi:acetyltransferase-like isoleucine patch superfamily enzyme
MHSIRAFYQKNSFAKCGKNVSVGHKCDFILSNIYCGDNVTIGDRASFIASIANIYIGNYVMFGPNVTIRGGNHRTDIKGKYMIQIKADEKLPENDEDVIIEDDVWVGCNVTILKGVVIGRGSVVAAGALVNKSCLPYSIIGGVPAKMLKTRWENLDDIIEHERLLYTENERLTRKQIEDIFNNCFNNI